MPPHRSVPAAGKQGNPSCGERNTAVASSSPSQSSTTDSYFPLGSTMLPTGASSTFPTVNSSGDSISPTLLQRTDQHPPEELGAAFKR
ncbi:hypothetical protein D3C87_1594450 [compost metagenome]